MEYFRFELIAQGSIPTTFQAYLAVAISVEQNQAAAALSRPESSFLPPRLPFPPRPIPLPSPPLHQPAPSPSYPTPMDLDATKGPRGPLTPKERQRRSDA